MPKESNNLRNKKSQSSKPYDVSNSSFVQRATTRVLDLLPQTSWLSRWWAPTDEPGTSSEPDLLLAGHNQESVQEFRTITTRSDLNAVNNTTEIIPSKRPKLQVNTPFNIHSQILQARTHGSGNEEISPIMTQSEPSTSRSNPRQFTFTPHPVASGSQLLDKVNAGDDCSESSESTSGCSSLLPQAQSTINQRMNDLNANSSPNRSILPNSNMSLSFYRSSGRRPTFNTSTFSSPLKSCLQDRTGGSPFYSGRTMYGGASANNLSCMSSTRRLGPTVRPVQAKNEQVPLSSTAKKILDALEQFSTPILDAKRIPVTIGTKRKAEASKRYTELTVPTTTDLLRVKRRERLQKSTSDARQTSATSTFTNSLTSLQSSHPELKTQEVEYKLREKDASHQKNAGKLRTRWKERQRATDIREEDTVPDVRLPNVKLPLKSLPSIDITIPLPSSTVPSDGSSFSFSAPIQDKRTSSTAITTPTVNFKFSEPLSETNNLSVSVKSDNNSNSKSVMNFNFVGSVKVKNDKSVTKAGKIVSDEVSDKHNIVKPAAQLETGSVMDVLLNRKNSAGKNMVEDTDKSKVLEDSWTCEACFIKNSNEESICVSCRTQKFNKTQESKPVKSTQKCSLCSKDNTSTDSTVCSSCRVAEGIKPPSEGFGDKFKKSVGSWECTTCLLNNKPDATKCVACETVKVGIDSKKSAPTVDSGFGNMFKPVSGSWECKSCLIVNKAELNKCAACETVRNVNESNTSLTSANAGFGTLFKKPSGSWECEACMLQNASDKNVCAACTTPRPGVKVTETKVSSAPQFTFGVPKGMDNASLGFKLGGFKAVDQSQTNSMPTFNFGIPSKTTIEDNPSSTTSLPKSTPTFQFGMSNQTQPSSTETFSFGIPKKEENTNLLINGSNNKSKASLTESKSELKNELFKSTEDKHVTSKLLESKNEILKNSLTDSSNSKPSGINSFESTKTTSNKIIDDQSEKPKLSCSNPFMATQSVSGVTQTSLSTSTTVTPSNLLKLASSKSIATSNETKSISSIVPQNTQLGFNLSNEPKNVPNVLAKNMESKPNVFNVSNEAKPSFGGFQSPSSSTAPTFGVTMPAVNEQKVSNTNTITKNFIFAPINKEQTALPFGSQKTTPNLNIFGSANTITTHKATPNVFGTAATTTSSSVPTFSSFGNANSFPSAIVNPTVSENKPAAIFAFGAPANKPIEQPAGFGFATPTASNSSNAGFVFNPVTSQNPGFNFSPKVEPKPSMFSSNISTFGSVGTTPSPSVFGTPQPQPTPGFGETVAPSPVFAFGSGTQTQQPANTMFGFGTTNQGTAPAPTASPAFVFGATPAAASPVPAFDPNARPTFNFTGGAQPSTFTATPSITPSPAANPQRKIRKAVRRQPTRQN